MSAALVDLLRRGRRRLRAVWLAATSTAFAPWVAAAAVLIALVGWVRPWSWPEPTAVGLLLVALVAVAVGATALRLPEHTVARALDRSLDTDDALVSALQFSPADPFGDRVHARAESFAAADVRSAMPTPWRPKPWLLAGALVAGLVVLVVVRNPQDSVRDRLAADQEAIEEVAEQFEDAAEQLEAEQTGDEADALAQELRELAESLREADDLESAIDELEAAQDELLRSIDAEDLAQRAAAQGLERTLQQNPLGAGSNAAEQFSSLADSLEQLTAEEQAELAERLEQLADTQSAGDPDTSEALQDAADALQQGTDFCKAVLWFLHRKADQIIVRGGHVLRRLRID